MCAIRERYSEIISAGVIWIVQLHSHYGIFIAAIFYGSEERITGRIERNGGFIHNNRSAVPLHSGIYKLRWVHALKNTYDGSEFEKSKVVGMNYRDPIAKNFPAPAPKIQIGGHRLAI